SLRSPSISTLFPYTTLFRSSGLPIPIPDLINLACNANARCWVFREGDQYKLLEGPEIKPADTPYSRSVEGQSLSRRPPDEAFLRSEEHTSELQSLTNLVCRL